MDALLASACAPLMFQGVEIDGEVYWDGSYASNPTLAPLYNGEPPDVDILMVELTPLNRSEVPTSAKNILNRINEIASINGLMAELRAIELVNRNITGADIPIPCIEHAGGARSLDAGALSQAHRRDGTL